MNIEGYDYVDLCQKVGATQLLSENADYFAELIRCSALVAALPESAAGPWPITDIEYDVWLNSAQPMAFAPETGGDPQERLFAAEIPFLGRAFLVLPVEYSDDAFVLECLLEAASQRINNSQFVADVTDVAVLGLAISDMCLREAKISRHTEPSSTDNDEIRWPRGKMARDLQHCVSFDRNEFQRYLAELGVGASGLDHLGFQQGTLPESYEHLLENPVRVRPLLVTSNRIVLVSPMTVNNAIRDAVLRIAVNMEAVADLMSAYHDVVASRVALNARRLRWEERVNDRVVVGDVVISEGVYSTDVDMVMVTYLVTDILIHGETSVTSYHWNTESSLAVIKVRINTNGRQLKALFGEGTEIVHCVVTQGIGRSYCLSVPEIDQPKSYCVWCSADEFGVFSLLNLGDSLAMWRVSASRKRLPRKMSMIGGGFLDHYALYRSRDESYYFGDEGIPDGVFFVASGIGPRLELAKTVDPHYVPSSNGKSLIRVFRYQNVPDFQVYCPDPHTVECIELLVEGLPRPIWVVAADTCALADGETRSACFHLIDTVAFWLWQLTPDILKLIDDTKAKYHTIEVDSKTFFATRDCSVEPTTTGVVHKQLRSGRSRVSFTQDYASLCALPNNSAELELARVLLRLIASKFNAEIDEQLENTIVSSHSGNGHKRRMAIIDGTLAGILDTQGLPAPCKVLPFDEQAIQDQLAEELYLSGAINEGRIPDPERHSILNKAVATMYRELQELIALYSSEELIVELVMRHESLVAERRHFEKATNTHLACFGRTQQTVRELQREIAEVDKASIANRFLIEYAAARPPQGTKRFSKASYLRMLALAASIFQTGQLSDSLRYGLSELSISLLKSRRIQIQDEEYDSAMSAFHNAFFDRLVESGLSEREQRRNRRAERNTSDLERRELETATEAEFGFSISEMGRFLSCVAGSRFTTNSGLGHCEIGELRTHLVGELSLAGDAIDQLLGIFILAERPDYLKLPDPYRPGDVYPWVFNRRLSYLRRPLIAHGIYATWGTRAIHQAANYLFDICWSGRLKDANSYEMRSFQGRLVDRLGNAFNDEIASLIRSAGEYLVRPRAKKFNGHRLARENGEDLGDIDVLAVNGRARLIFPIEAKFFSFSKTSAEVARERDELFGDLAQSSGKIGRHLERVEWLRAHLSDVLRELGLSVDGDWRIQPIVVLDVDLISVHLVSSPIQIATRETLLDVLRHSIEESPQNTASL